MSRFGWSAILFALACGANHAAVELPDLYRQTIEQGVANGAFPVLAVGMIDGDDQKTVFFGKTSASNDSAFEIGAISEIVTGLLLAQDAIDGKVRMRDTVRQLLPSEFSFADARVGDITLEELITHRSGLPTVPANLFPGDADDPYADYSEADLLRLIGNAHLAEPDHKTNYSTLDAGLLAMLLARLHATSVTAQIKSRVLEPLTLTHTTFADPPELVDGHVFGQPAKHWHYDALSGAAGLRSTLGDLLMFLRRNLAPDAAPLRGALLLSRQSRASASNDELGLGWNVRESKGDGQSWPLVWRASETGGFSTFIGFRSDRRKALVLLANTVEDLAGLGVAWLGDEAPPPPARSSHPPELAQLATYPGLYRITNGSELTVRQTTSGLSIQMYGQPPWRLRGYDDDAFVANAGAIGVSFVRDIDHISGLLLRIDNGHVSASRLSEHAPRLTHVPIAVDRSSLERYVGVYQIDADTLVRIALGTDGLTLQMTASPRTIIRPYAPDRFADADGFYDVTFERDEAGNPARLKLGLAGADRTAALVHWR